ncbi:hypothetical protein SAMN05216360_108184 [Methylobacterium phyllostachyos]|uniref:Uncharacterized protein n=1 Tax=Methylobacterium phyllostachyos TaxID=582672 RepID=A0A1H0BI55_9HYPH|nr:hypothetical protein [Methylobacterium phyllostachyos]SDN45312.1 hypothetical protein SAMN05216360_108184 [Methylobacterium phyllostachyos]
MRALLTSGIKAILAVAALSTAAHWTLRVQRESAISVAAAAVPDPVATGSIAPRRVEPPLAAASPAPAPAVPAPSSASGLDQSHLAALMAGAAPPRKAAKPVTKPATKTASVEKAAVRR